MLRRVAGDQGIYFVLYVGECGCVTRSQKGRSYAISANTAKKRHKATTRCRCSVLVQKGLIRK